MAKLTRKQRTAIEAALRNAERAYTYIMRPDIAIARREDRPGLGTRLTYVRTPVTQEQAKVLGVAAGGAALSEVTKEIGSDLCCLARAIAELRELIAA